MSWYISENKQGTYLGFYFSIPVSSSVTGRHMHYHTCGRDVATALHGPGFHHLQSNKYFPLPEIIHVAIGCMYRAWFKLTEWQAEH